MSQEDFSFEVGLDRTYKTSKITNSKNSNNKKVNICEQKYLLEAQGDKTKISNTAKENNNLILYGFRTSARLSL